MLRDWSQERAGRIQKEKSDKKNKDKQNSTAIKSASPPDEPPSSSTNFSTVSDFRRSDAKEMDEQAARAAAAVVAAEVANMNNASLVVDDGQSIVSFTAGANAAKQKTAGLLVIGNEILKGSTQDTNTFFAAKAFRDNSVFLKRVMVVSDDQEEIIRAVLTLQGEVGKSLYRFDTTDV